MLTPQYEVSSILTECCVQTVNVSTENPHDEARWQLWGPMSCSFRPKVVHVVVEQPSNWS